MRISPLVGSIIRLTIRSRVVLPDPDGRTSTVMRPPSAVRSVAETATVPSGYVFPTCTKEITRRA